ncbi:MAG: ABC transporter permease, partial [Deinococcus sp.]|nr:ABC transporter permease [Deinococcus sp.]
MLQFLARRLGYAVIVLWGVSTITFVLLHLTGDPTLALVPLNATAEAIATIRQAWGFDQPLPVQYARFLASVAQGKFGTSTRHRRPAMDLIVEHMPATLELAFTSMLFAVFAAVPAGIVAAVRRNTPVETLTMTGALLGLSIPTFWLGIMLILLFGVALRWLPVSGRGTLAHIVLPALATGTFVMAQIARLVRSTVLEQLRQDYVRTARA